MSARIVVISNNPRIFSLDLPEWERIDLPGSAVKVLETARDKIHLGRRLLHHPLYGNFRPGQQPFRTIILEEPGARPCAPDPDSLRLIEAAMAVYRADKALLPEEAPGQLFDDCSLLDFELLRATLSQFGWAG